MEGLNRRKSQRLRTFFLKVLAAFCAMTLGLIGLLVTGFLIALSTGAVLPANAVEARIALAKDVIRDSAHVTPDLIPAACDYAVFARDGALLGGDLPPDAATVAWRAVNGEPTGSYYAFYRIDRVDEVCVLRYQIKAAYGSAWANRFLPPPEIAFLGGFVVFFLAGSAGIAACFGRTLSTKMGGLNEATQKIQDQDLDFETKPSGIREIDEVLSSMDRMRLALKGSLEKQWEMENLRKRQLSALAHDIKAPVTVIRGNAELMEEMPCSEVQVECLYYIREGAAQLERYVRRMIEVAKAQEVLAANVQMVGTVDVFREMVEQTKALAVTKRIDVVADTEDLPDRISIDRELFLRAFLNVAANAVEHTPEGGTIDVCARGENGGVAFVVTDGGQGFTEDGLRNAKNEFYMGDEGRTPGAHYGMGLYIADTILRQHGGSLTLANAPQCGGVVTLMLPV